MKYLLGLATSATLILNGESALLANDLMSGIHPFLCNKESFVIIEDNNTWSVANSNLEVLTADNGWRFEDRDEGDVGYLTETRDGEWELNWLSSYGPEKSDCVDLFSATDQVVEIIRPKIDQNIVTIQSNLESVEGRLATALADLAKAATSAEVQVNEFKIKEAELKYLRPALERERSELREATATIKSLKEELRVSQGKVKYYSNALEAERQSNKE